MMTGYQQQYNRIIITAAAIGIGLNFLLVPILGIEGAAYSSTISKIIWNLWSVYFVYKNLGLVSIYLPGIKRPTSTTATEFNFKEKPENEQ
jgi:O-antigen/teichoic acid export membrane protein